MKTTEKEKKISSPKYRVNSGNISQNWSLSRVRQPATAPGPVCVDGVDHARHQDAEQEVPEEGTLGRYLRMQNRGGTR